MATQNFWGGLIRSLREEQGISQRMLVERARINRNTLRRLESGETGGYIEDIERALNYLGYDLEALERGGIAHRLQEQMRAETDPKRRSQLAAKKLSEMRLT